jgi:hypothetical protein
MSKDIPKSPDAPADISNTAPEFLPPQPQVLGEVLPDELQRLGGLKQQADQTVQQIGLAVVSAFRMMGNLQQAEMATNQIIKAAGERLGIPEGTPWSVTMDGKAVLVQQPGMPQQMPQRPRPVPVPTPEEKPTSPDPAMGESKE